MQIEKPSEHEVVVRHTFAAKAKAVFRAWTDPSLISRWMQGPEGWKMTECRLDLRPGGEFLFEWRHPTNGELTISGTYHEITPPTRIVASESWGVGWPDTLNTVTFEEHGDKTTLTLTVFYPSETARDNAVKKGLDLGMQQSMARLEELLTSVR